MKMSKNPFDEKMLTDPQARLLIESVRQQAEDARMHKRIFWLLITTCILQIATVCLNLWK